MSNAYFTVHSGESGEYCARFNGRQIGTGVGFLGDDADSAARKILEISNGSGRVVVDNSQDKAWYRGVHENMFTLLSDALYAHAPPSIDLVVEQ